MDDILTAQFDRVERALGTLVDSIAAYNPSPQAAIDLVAADDDLSQGLDQLAKHQANHARIQTLHAQADALEEKLRSSVGKLATLRHELFDTPATTFPDSSRAVTVEELLQNASYISKHTVPPTYRERVPDAVQDQDNDKDDAGSSAVPTNGVNTPARAPDPTEVAKDTIDGQKDGEPAVAEITAEEEEWLRKLRESQFPWYPWPSNDKIRMGNLQKLMYHREKGDDLNSFDVKAHYSDMLAGAPAKAPTPDALPEAVAPGEAQPRVSTTQRPPPKPKADLDIFDDMDDY
ncbi:hypothetical protein ACN47E_003922 [Coniothyrium glycines]